MPQLICNDLTLGYDSRVISENINFQVNKVPPYGSTFYYYLSLPSEAFIKNNGKRSVIFQRYFHICTKNSVFHNRNMFAGF